jgi:transglutaminase-like putative cysteine protease
VTKKAAFVLFLLGSAPLPAATAVYLVHGRDATLFDHYDVDGYSLEAVPVANGLRLTVRTAPEPRGDDAVFCPATSPAAGLTASPERDALSRRLTRDSSLESQAIDSILSWISREITYDPQRSLPQDPASVFGSRRAYCVGFAELAVDMLRRAGISAATVQGVLVSEPETPGYDPDLSGVYHRWVKVFYPGRGWRFADPLAGFGGVGARYVPFSDRAWTKPEDLKLWKVRSPGP